MILVIVSRFDLNFILYIETFNQKITENVQSVREGLGRLNICAVRGGVAYNLRIKIGNINKETRHCDLESEV